MTFTGFTHDALALLPKLPGFDADNYDAQRECLGNGLRLPGTALIQEVAEALPVDLRVVPRSSVSPLHRDLRFAKPGAARYKDHLLLTTWEGHEKSSAAVLWMRIDGASVGFATGIAFTPPIRDRWRSAVASEAGRSLSEHLTTLGKKHARHSFEIDAERNKRVPKPWDETHPRADLLRFKNFQARFMEPHPTCITEKRFTSWCVKRLEPLIPVHRWLVEHLVTNTPET